MTQTAPIKIERTKQVKIEYSTFERVFQFDDKVLLLGKGSYQIVN